MTTAVLWEVLLQAPYTKAEVKVPLLMCPTAKEQAP